MPELPEVETTARGIRPWLESHHVTKINVRNPRLRWPVPKTIQQLLGTKINTVTRRGKYLLINCNKGTAIIHLGMSGSLRISDPQLALRKHDHVEFILSNDLALRYHDPRRFGCILWEKEDPYQHPLLCKLGPEPLEDGFNADYLLAIAKSRKVPIKSLIMNSHTVVGVGNIYASESLFLSGIRPGKGSARLTRNDIHRLTTQIKEVLSAAINQGGTTLKDFVNSEGNPGYFAQSLKVYGRKGEPCRVCGHTIASKLIAQRASYYCPNCQK